MCNPCLSNSSGGSCCHSGLVCVFSFSCTDARLPLRNSSSPFVTAERSSWTWFTRFAACGCVCVLSLELLRGRHLSVQQRTGMHRLVCVCATQVSLEKGSTTRQHGSRYYGNYCDVPTTCFLVSAPHIGILPTNNHFSGLGTTLCILKTTWVS
jgi:hypothetical protein